MFHFLSCFSSSCCHSSLMAQVMASKEVVLERAVATEGRQGSFGFTIHGGAGSKLPAVVCEIDADGPAAHSGQVSLT